MDRRIRVTRGLEVATQGAALAAAGCVPQAWGLHLRNETR